jgi:hypothetical protein
MKPFAFAVEQFGGYVQSFMDLSEEERLRKKILYNEEEAALS